MEQEVIFTYVLYTSAVQWNSLRLWRCFLCCLAWSSLTPLWPSNAWSNRYLIYFHLSELKWKHRWPWPLFWVARQLYSIWSVASLYIFANLCNTWYDRNDWFSYLLLHFMYFNSFGWENLAIPRHMYSRSRFNKLTIFKASSESFLNDVSFLKNACCHCLRLC